MLFILLTSACTSAMMQFDSNHSKPYNQHLAQLLLHGKDSNDCYPKMKCGVEALLRMSAINM